MEEMKLLLRKAIFSGKTFVGHCEKIFSIVESMDDEELSKFFEDDNDAAALLSEWVALKEYLYTAPE